MTLGLVFWIIMLILAIFIGVGILGPVGYSHYGTAGGGIVTFVLFLIVGWQIWGAPVRRG